MRSLFKKIIEFYEYLKELNEYFDADYTTNDRIREEAEE